ncbi:hypothetical protein O1611_g3721 [Lasiodiplodia mahajangana]|uniref:Uncharacterized protein n=1 Tax=Lasiodiplodia mahajangana TaxID=1108764 RepID=A0ACC2JRL6_9PEZI|nr:hypothetical protein O1611_g3721 [Lasiodiplodia mahajangana]
MDAKGNNLSHAAERYEALFKDLQAQFPDRAVVDASKNFQAWKSRLLRDPTYLITNNGALIREIFTSIEAKLR